MDSMSSVDSNRLTELQDKYPAAFENGMIRRDYGQQVNFADEDEADISKLWQETHGEGDAAQGIYDRRGSIHRVTRKKLG